MSEETVFDMFGRELKIGHDIVYPVRTRSLMWLKKMRVTQIGPAYREGVKKIVPITGINDNGRSVTIVNPMRCAIIEL